MPCIQIKLVLPPVTVDIGDLLNFNIPKPTIPIPELACCKLPIPPIILPDIPFPQVPREVCVTINTAVRTAQTTIQSYIDQAFAWNLECPRL